MNTQSTVTEPATSRLREVSDEELQGILDANLQWTSSGGNAGQKADLSHTNLRDRDLIGAQLRDCNFQAADLTGADLRDTDLTNSDLSGARGLSQRVLGGSILTDAKLPEAISNFEGLEHVEKTSQNARRIFLTMLLGCVYAWLAIATTTDARLLINAATSPLPIIRTQIPIADFYWAAPLILLSLYIYLHLYLYQLWRGLAALPAVFPDGKALDERAYPWLLNGIVLANFYRLKGERQPLSRVQNFVSIMLAWWFVPATLLLFWGRYLPRHDWPGTILLIVLLMAAAGYGFHTYFLARCTLQGHLVNFDWNVSLHNERIRLVGLIVTLGVAISGLSIGAIKGDSNAERTLADVRTWVPWIFESIGYRTYANLTGVDISIRPENWSGEEDNVLVKGAKLIKKDLRFAIFDGAFLVKADFAIADVTSARFLVANLHGATFMGANLQKAVFEGADLQNVDFSVADLMDAEFQSAKLKGAEFVSANLRRADLSFADLQGAGLAFTDMRGANLRNANLQGANTSGVLKSLLGKNIRGPDLEGANLLGTNLMGADLSASENLNQPQLDQACGDRDTKLPDGLTVEPCLGNPWGGRPLPRDTYDPGPPI